MSELIFTGSEWKKMLAFGRRIDYHEIRRATGGNGGEPQGST
jgi:hypothetical protein